MKSKSHRDKKGKYNYDKNDHDNFPPKKKTELRKDLKKIKKQKLILEDIKDLYHIKKCLP